MNPLGRADVDMWRVVEAWTRRGGRAVAGLSVADARDVPTLAEGAAAERPDARQAVAVRDLSVDGAAGRLSARLYRAGEGTAVPGRLILFFGGGGFVRNSLRSAEPVARELAVLTGFAVLSVEPRRAPEAKFPAAAEDAGAAYKWLVANAASLGGDPMRLVVAGEETGGTLAVDTLLAARGANLPMPVHLLLITPLAGTDTGTASYEENAKAQPLGKADVLWALDLSVRNAADRADPRLDLIGQANLAGFPATTIVTAQIDPLRSDGERLAARLRRTGIDAERRDFPGVTHGFFALPDVAEARLARAFVASRLQPPETTAAQ